MKLTKQQRHMAYMIMLAEWEEEIKKPICGSLHGFCLFINRFFCKSSFELTISDFPEIKNKKPKYRQGIFWFGILEKSEQRKRIEILKQCIEETY